MNTRPRLGAALSLLCWTLVGAAGQAAPVAGDTQVIGPFTGHYAPLHPANVAPIPIEYYGTDLGFTYEHAGLLHFIFGDSNVDEAGNPIEASSGGRFDDGFGTVDLAQWPDPALITPDNIPRIRLGQNPGTAEMSAIDTGHAMEGFKTPVGGFSNGQREFGIFYTSKPQACATDADCDNSLSCDTGLGYVGQVFSDDAGYTFACVDGTPECNDDPLSTTDGKAVAGSGLCLDRGSSVWADSDIGRISATGMKHRAGIRSTTDPRKYTSLRTWRTTRFANPALRTVQDFDGDANGHDYRPATGSGQNRRLFLWGRPGFVGVGATGRSLGLYFACTDLPAGEDFSWNLHYYTGTDRHGRPMFSRREVDAAALDLDDVTAGVQAQEMHDIVDQMSIAWIEALRKWVMFYGGGMVNMPTAELPDCGILQFFTGSECLQVTLGNGAIRMRTADHPWGPWSAPQDVIVAGDPEADPVAGQYAPGGLLYHPRCGGDSCETRTNADGIPPEDFGFFYAANLIEQWTTTVDGGVDVIWNVSTWNPYRVVLMRTRIDR